LNLGELTDFLRANVMKIQPLADTMKSIEVVMTPKRGKALRIKLRPEFMNYCRSAELVTDRVSGDGKVTHKATGRETLTLTVTGLRVKKPA
jgi:hypothetical protein